jgi:hypothetical protein
MADALGFEQSGERCREGGIAFTSNPNYQNHFGKVKPRPPNRVKTRKNGFRTPGI